MTDVGPRRSHTKKSICFSFHHMMKLQRRNKEFDSQRLAKTEQLALQQKN